MEMLCERTYISPGSTDSAAERPPTAFIITIIILCMFLINTFSLELTVSPADQTPQCTACHYCQCQCSVDTLSHITSHNVQLVIIVNAVWTLCLIWHHTLYSSSLLSMSHLTSHCVQPHCMWTRDEGITDQSWTGCWLSHSWWCWTDTELRPPCCSLQSRTIGDGDWCWCHCSVSSHTHTDESAPAAAAAVITSFNHTHTQTRTPPLAIHCTVLLSTVVTICS